MTRPIFAILLFAACLIAAPGYADDFASRFAFTKAPAAVPTFPFQDGKSRTLDLKEFRGHYVLLNLWATWCGPCVQEMATLDKLAQKFLKESPQPQVDIIALTEDHDGLTAAQGFYRRHKLSHLPVFVDDAGVAVSILHIRGLPTTLLIDPNGKEIGRLEGDAEWDDPATIAFLEKQMKRATK